MDKINLVSVPPWGPGEIRALMLRHLLGACLAVFVTCIGLFTARLLIRCSEISDGAHDSNVVNDLTRCQAERDELTRAHQWLLESKASRGLPTQTLQIFEQAMPADVWLRELVISGNSIEVVGLSRSEASVGELVGLLRSIEGFPDAHLESSQITADSSREVREFRVSGILTVKAHEGEKISE